MQTSDFPAVTPHYMHYHVVLIMSYLYGKLKLAKNIEPFRIYKASLKLSVQSIEKIEIPMAIVC